MAYNFFIASTILRQTLRIRCCAVACDEIHVNKFTAPIIRVMIVKDFLGKDQNADIYITRRVICSFYFETSNRSENQLAS